MMPMINLQLPEIPFPNPLPPFPEPPRLPVPEPLPKPIPFPGPGFPFPWFKECTPQILVITDGLNFLTSDPFGLTEFVATLRASSIHGMTPIVTTAMYNPGGVLSYNPATQHITNFKFTDPTRGLTIARYDVVFLLGSGGAPLSSEAGGLNAIIAFMQAGGGLFATGDHADLGASLCQDIPRVGSMRLWSAVKTPLQPPPSQGGVDRLSTNAPGSNDIYEFNDQSDALAQRLYVNFRTIAGTVGSAHPVLQIPASARAIEVFPDHPHEGECVIPSNLNTKMPDGITNEWPSAISPEMVALSVSHGNAFPFKEALTPRAFIAICAYNGQPANVGRVVTDATWHHFVNVNIKPGFSALAGRDLSDIKQYYSNLATWLMPKITRKCRWIPDMFTELVRYPLAEELNFVPIEKLDATQLLDVGKTIEAALLSRRTLAQVRELIDDLLTDSLGVEALARLKEQSDKFKTTLLRDAGLAALAAYATSIASGFEDFQAKAEKAAKKPHAAEMYFGKLADQGIKSGVQKYLTHANNQLSAMNKQLKSMLI